MAHLGSLRSCFEQVAHSAVLDVLLPRHPPVDVAALIAAGTPTEVSRVPVRRNLFFDENANILAVLKTAATERDLRDILPHLELIVAAHATDAVPQGSGAAAFASGKHDLNTKTVSAGSFKDIVTAHDHSYVVWEPCLHLSRPPARLQRPAVYFTANLVLSDQQQDSPNKLSAPVLASFEPLSANVLEPLDSGRVQGAPNVYMSASKITKVAPKPSTLSDAAKSIRGATRRAFPLLPALFTRIRYSNLPGAVVASLHLEPSHILSGSIRILEAELTGSNAHIEDLTRIKLPLEACGGDETILLYKIVNDSGHPRGGSQISISIRAEVLLNQGSQIVLEIDWQTDLSHTLQSPLYQWSRPAAVSSHRKSHSIQSLGTLSGEHAPARAEVASGGVTFIFTRKPLVQASSDFKLLVHCNNRSSRPRRFGLMIVQTRKSWLIKQSAPADVAVSDVGARVFCTPPMERSKPSNALDLNADLRIGPLPPGACFEAHMSFVLLRPGVLDLGTIRIIDLDTRQTVDVEELLDIVAPDTCTSEHQARTGHCRTGYMYFRTSGENESGSDHSK